MKIFDKSKIPLGKGNRRNAEIVQKTMLILLCLKFIASAEIISGIDTLNLRKTSNDFNQRINFSSGTVTGLTVNFSDYQYFKCYPCTTHLADIDFFTYFIDYCTCICPSVFDGAIGSPRPFYKSKSSFFSLNLKQSLNLNDSSLFHKIDTMTVDTSAHSKSACVLPFETITRVASEMVYIVKTSSNKFVLVRLKPFDDSIYSDCGVKSAWYSYLGGFVLTWYLQNSGSLDFNAVDQTEVRRTQQSPKSQSQGGNSSIFLKHYKIGLAKDAIKHNAINYYSIKGEAIKNIQLKMRNDLFIYR